MTVEKSNLDRVLNAMSPARQQEIKDRAAVIIQDIELSHPMTVEDHRRLRVKVMELILNCSHEVVKG